VGETLNNITSVILAIYGQVWGALWWIKMWPPRIFALDLMVIQCFKPFTLGWSHKQWNRLFLISLVCIMWHIGPPWWFWLWANWARLCILKMCCNIYILIFSHNPNKVLDFTNLAKTLEIKGLKLLPILRPIGYQHLALWNRC